MIAFPLRWRSNRLLPFGRSGVLADCFSRSGAPIRWPASAGHHKAERERSQPMRGFVRRKRLIPLAFCVLPGSGRVTMPPPPLRFSQAEGDGPQLLPARKMGDPQGGAGGIDAC